MFVTPGALVAGYEVGRWTGGGKYNWQRIVAGLGAVGVGIYFSKDAQKEYQAAIEAFNQQQKKQTSWNLMVFPSTKGVALQVVF